MSKWFAAGVAAAAVAGPLAGPALPATQRPARQVEARGNPFTGGLEFAPKRTATRVGNVVQWKNVDPVVPHTATEDHGLWDLTGTYGQTPFNPPGFGPGETRSRVFEAGTQHYYCRVHPTMKGVVAIPVFLSRSVQRRSGGTRYLIVARWAARKPESDRVFDVEVRRGNGSWKRVRRGTRSTGMRFDGGAIETVWSVRARLRRASKPSDATDWSPVISIRA